MLQFCSELLDSNLAEFQSEKSSKSRVERQCKDLDRELSDLQERLEEAGGATAAQV